jgi:hypothetical protein
MAQTIQAINVAFTTTSSFTPAAPVQRQFFIDSNVANYYRNATLTQDSLYLSYYTTSIVIPLTVLYNAAATYNSWLSWAPFIITEPSNSFVTHPATATFKVTASSNFSIAYQWYSQSYSQSVTSSTVYYPLTASAGVFLGVTGSILYVFNTSQSMSTSSFYCQVSNNSGITNTSTATLYVY